MRKILLSAFLLTGLASFVKAEEASVTIDKGVMKPVSIAICPFIENESGEDPIGLIVKNDLTSTGLFSSVNSNAFLQQIDDYDKKVAYQNWSAIGAQYLLIGKIAYKDKNQVSVSFKLYDIVLHKKACEFTINGNVKYIRKIAHHVANHVYKYITGGDGYFDTKVAYISVAKKKNGRKIHRLAVMDYDGYDHRFLTDGTNIVLTPRFSPDSDELIFFSYGEKVVRGRRYSLPGNLYMYSFENNTITPVLPRSTQMNYAPRFSPDGKKIIYSMTNSSGHSSIYEMDLQTKNVKRITKRFCIDTSPCYSPDMSKIVFNSDRGGSQQLYVMNADGSDPKRISFGKGRYATPVWSPNGEWIAFTRFGRGKFYIGIMKPDGSKERLLACGYLVEGPTWSPNSRVLMFSHQDRSGIEKMHSIDITGFNQREIITPLDGIDPEWNTPKDLAAMEKNK